MLFKKNHLFKKRVHSGGIGRGHVHYDDSSFGSCFDAERGTGADGQQYGEHHSKPDRRRLLSLLRSRSGISVIELLIAMPIIFFCLYFVVDQWVVLSKHQMAEHTMHKYLTRMEIEGGLTSADQAKLIADFQNFSCIIDNPATDIVATDGAGNLARSGNGRVLRPGQVSIRVSCRPVPAPLISGKAIGASTPDSSYRIIVGGAMLSERVNPGTIP